MARILVLLFGFMLSATVAGADRAPAPAAPPVVVHFITGDGCPHCAKARPFLADLAARHPGVQVQEIEIWKNRDNRPRARWPSAGASNSNRCR